MRIGAWLPGKRARDRAETDADGRLPAPPAKYAELLDQLKEIHPSHVQTTYLDRRWLELVVGARARADRDQRLFATFNGAALAAAAITPVVVTATAATTGSLRSALTTVAICLSLLAAAGGVSAQTLRPGIRWRLHRMLRDDLEKAAWRLLATSNADHAPVNQATTAWDQFVKDVEQASGTYNLRYAQEVAGVIEQRPVMTEVKS